MPKHTNEPQRPRMTIAQAAAWVNPVNGDEVEDVKVRKAAAADAEVIYENLKEMRDEQVQKRPDIVNKDEDIRHIKEKVDAGCDFLTTQMFFNNSIYYNYLYRLREAGVTVPILAGIMPVTSRRQMERSIQLSGCVIPPELAALVDRFGDSPEAMQKAGIIYASHQIIDLIANGCGHIHVYTMNKPEVAEGILYNLRGII